MARLKIDWGKTLGEFLIIVIGVLAALAVDEWRSDRQDQQTERDYLARLKVDLEQDIANFTYEIGIMGRKAGFLQGLLDKTMESRFADDPVRLMEDKVISSFGGVPDSVATTFDELKSTGRLALIRDVEIRMAMSEYYSAYRSLNEQVNAVLVAGDYSRLIQGIFPGRIAREWRLENTISEPDEFLQSLLTLQEHPDVTAAANMEITYATALEFYIGRFRDQATELIELLDSVQPQ